MRVVVLTTSWPRSEREFAGRFVADAVERLGERGVEVEVLAPEIVEIEAPETVDHEPTVTTGPIAEAHEPDEGVAVEAPPPLRPSRLRRRNRPCRCQARYRLAAPTARARARSCQARRARGP